MSDLPSRSKRGAWKLGADGRTPLAPTGVDVEDFREQIDVEDLASKISQRVDDLLDVPVANGSLAGRPSEVSPVVPFDRVTKPPRREVGEGRGAQAGSGIRATSGPEPIDVKLNWVRQQLVRRRAEASRGGAQRQRAFAHPNARRNLTYVLIGVAITVVSAVASVMLT